jgi:hypothetical protein
MPIDWRGRVRQAARAGDSSQLHHLISLIPHENVFLIKELTELAHHYQFRQIQALTSYELD